MTVAEKIINKKPAMLPIYGRERKNKVRMRKKLQMFEGLPFEKRIHKLYLVGNNVEFIRMEAIRTVETNNDGADDDSQGNEHRPPVEITCDISIVRYVRIKKQIGRER